MECGLVKKVEDKKRRNDGGGGEDEFIHQVSLRVQSVLHCASGHQSQTGSGSSQLTRPEGCCPGLGCLRAPPAGPPSPPGPVSPGCGCWSPPETCTSAPGAHWWDLPHTGRDGVMKDKWRAAEEWIGETKRKKKGEGIKARGEERSDMNLFVNLLSVWECLFYISMTVGCYWGNSKHHNTKISTSKITFWTWERGGWKNPKKAPDRRWTLHYYQKVKRHTTMQHTMPLRNPKAASLNTNTLF